MMARIPIHPGPSLQEKSKEKGKTAGARQRCLPLCRKIATTKETPP